MNTFHQSPDYKINVPIETEDIIELYRSSGIRRPIDDTDRIATMYRHSNLVVSAWYGSELVGISRALTDFSFCCYLSDLAVKGPFQNLGIGKKLLALTKENAGTQSMLLLLSAPAAMHYYPKVGMEKVQNGYIIHRTQ